MDLRTQFELAKRVYMVLKLGQLVFLVVHIIYSYVVKAADDAIITVITSCFILVLVSVSWCMLYRISATLFSQHGYYQRYFNLIVLDFFNPFFAIGGYSISVYNINLEYDELKKKFYSHYVKDSIGLKMNKMTRFSRRLDNQPIDEDIETTTKLISRESIRHGKWSSISYEYYRKFLRVYRYIVSSFWHIAVACALGWIEFIKYRIRRAPQPVQEVEMVAMINAADDV
ncbi:hypothetical protein Anas_14125 [Armadillidium nasatum]|uniref:Uncharacterized protein n=1 Tax=Armadillidium nasatum TaxID=96803 RepID=A0A5N5T9X2_9CRUS|nr:hypothetical protein Anas_14125 [Armadillidium nasatum]